MELLPLAEVELVYRSLERVDFDAGGQIYGRMEGSVAGPRLAGALSLANLAPLRPDGVNLPTARGILTTHDHARVWVTLDGIATLREGDDARVFVTSFTFRTGDGRYAWLNTVFAVLEGVLDRERGRATGLLTQCRPTIGLEGQD